MQPCDRIERGKDRALLPGRHVGREFAREQHASIDGAEIGVVLRPLRRVDRQDFFAINACRENDDLLESAEK